MKILVDTHIFLWYLSGDPRLSKHQRKVWETSSSEKLLSIVSVWEMAVKVAIGKLGLSMPLEDFIRKHVEREGLTLVNLSLEESCRVSTLPMIHRDPFDRLLISQALLTKVPVITHDKVFHQYGVELIT